MATFARYPGPGLGDPNRSFGQVIAKLLQQAMREAGHRFAPRRLFLRNQGFPVSLSEFPRFGKTILVINILSLEFFLPIHSGGHRYFMTRWLDLGLFFGKHVHWTHEGARRRIVPATKWLDAPGIARWLFFLAELLRNTQWGDFPFACPG